MRTVKVELALEVARYLDPARRVQSANQSLSASFAKVDADIEDVATELKTVAKDSTAAAKAADEAADAVDDLGDEAKETAREVSHLDREIEQATRSLMELARAYDSTGDKALLKQIAATRSELNQLRAIRKDTGRDNEVAETVAEVTEDVSKGALRGFSRAVDVGLDTVFGTGLQELRKSIASNPVVTATATAFGAVVVAGAATAIGAAAAGVILAGTAVGAVAGGIALAAKDQRVQDAAGALSKTVMGDLDKIGPRFVEPTVDALDLLADTWTGLFPRVESAAKAAAGYVPEIAEGVSDFAKNAIPGITEAVEEAGPAVAALSRGLAGTGREIGGVFDQLAGKSNEAAAGVEFTFLAVNGVIDATGDSIEFLAGAFEKSTRYGAALSGVMEDVFGWAPLLGDMMRDNNDIAEHLNGIANGEFLSAIGSKIGQAAEGIARFKVEAADAANVVNTLMNSMLTLDGTTLGFNESLLQVSASFKENGRSLEMHTQKGIDNRQAVLASVDANLRVYNSMIQSGASAEEAAAKYDQNTAALEANLRKAGLTKAEIDGLIGKYRGVPGKVTTEMALQGMTKVLADLNETLRLINGLPPLKTVTVRYRVQGSPIAVQGATDYFRGQRWGGVTEHAEVGLLRDAQVYSAVSSGARYAFAEPATGGEAFVPKYGDHARSTAILQHAAGWYGYQLAPRTIGLTRPMTGYSNGGGGRTEVVHRLVVSNESGRVLLDKVLDAGLASSLVRMRNDGDLPSLA